MLPNNVAKLILIMKVKLKFLGVYELSFFFSSLSAVVHSEADFELFGVNLSEPRIQEKDMANSLYLCLYVCRMYVCMYVAIHRPRVHHAARMCAQCAKHYINA